MSVNAPEQRRRRLRAPARRARIVGAALDAFASGGFSGTGMAQIADAAGVTRAVLYDHFPSKKALFLGVLHEQNATFLGHVGASITGDGPPEQRMRATMDAVFSFAERYPYAWQLLYGNPTHGDPEIDAAWREIAGARHQAVAAMLTSDFRTAGIDPSSRRAEIVVEMLVGALSGAADWRARRPGFPRAELVDAGADLLWTGLGHLIGRPASASAD